MSTTVILDGAVLEVLWIKLQQGVGNWN